MCHSDEPQTPVAEKKSPISVSQLKRISQRLHARLKDETTLSLPSVQYVLSEVGRNFDRFDPRQLRVGLHLLGNNPRPGPDLPHGPWQPLPGIFVNTRITKRNAQHSASIAAATKVDQLRALADEYRESRVAAIIYPIATTIPGKSEIEEVEATTTEHMGGGVHWQTSAVQLHVRSRGRAPSALVWITNDISWLFPDDPRLWEVLLQASRTNQRLIVLARKIAVSTFPLLKRLGGFGLQVHHLYMPGGPPKGTAAERALVPGPLMYEAGDIRTHKAITENLSARLKATTQPLTNEVIDGLGLAAELGLASESPDRTELLRTWTSQTSIEMPPRWKAQLTLYVKWKTALERGGRASD